MFACPTYCSCLLLLSFALMRACDARAERTCFQGCLRAAAAAQVGGKNETRRKSSSGNKGRNEAPFPAGVIRTCTSLHFQSSSPRCQSEPAAALAQKIPAKLRLALVGWIETTAALSHTGASLLPYSTPHSAVRTHVSSSAWLRSTSLRPRSDGRRAAAAA